MFKANTLVQLRLHPYGRLLGFAARRAMSTSPEFTMQDAIAGAAVSEGEFNLFDGRVFEAVGGGKFAIGYAPFREYIEYEQMAETRKVAIWGMVLALVAIGLTIVQLVSGMGTPQPMLSPAQMDQLLSAVREPVTLRDSVISVRIQDGKTPFRSPQKR